MSAQTAIVLANGLATPVNHIFEPNGVFQNADGVIKTGWIDRTGSIYAAGRAVLREDHRVSTVPTGRDKIRFVLEVPTMETINGVIQKTRMCAFDCEFRFDPNALQAERDDIYAYAKNLLASSYMAAKVKTGERTW